MVPHGEGHNVIPGVLDNPDKSDAPQSEPLWVECESLVAKDVFTFDEQAMLLEVGFQRLAEGFHVKFWNWVPVHGTRNFWTFEITGAETSCKHETSWFSKCLTNYTAVARHVHQLVIFPARFWLCSCSNFCRFLTKYRLLLTNKATRHQHEEQIRRFTSMAHVLSEFRSKLIHPYVSNVTNLENCQALRKFKNLTDSQNKHDLYNRVNRPTIITKLSVLLPNGRSWNKGSCPPSGLRRKSQLFPRKWRMW